MFRKGQLSSEYLVNLTIIMLVALIVITLVVNASPIANPVPITQSKNYWSTTAPFAITEWKYSHKTLELTITNLDSKKLYLNTILMDTSLLYSSSDPFQPGETKIINATTKAPCGGEGDFFELPNIQIYYTKGSISGFTQKGDKAILGYCTRKNT
jgi:hypothetical protein